MSSQPRKIQITLDADLVDELHATFEPIGKGTTKTECVQHALRQVIEIERQWRGRAAKEAEKQRRAIT